MRQKPAYEQLEQRFHLDSCRELDPPLNKRFSLNLPDCSAVLDSQNNLMDTNEISWLEKFAEDNEKVCNSGLFDDVPPAPRPVPANDMKFSFNMNYLQDRRKDDSDALTQQSSPKYAKHEGRELAREYSTKKITREDTQVLADIQNTQADTRRARKESLPGSIKKNQKAKASLAVPEISEYQREIAESLPYNRLEEMNERLSKVLYQERISYVQQIANKQNAKLYSEVSMANLLSATPSASTLNTKLENTLKQHRRARHIPTIPLERSSSMNVDPVKPPTPTCEYSAALEALFNRLDKSQTGKLSRSNCDTEGIPEDFKFIFGGVFTSIRLKQHTCNKRQFVQSCEKAVKLLESSEAVDLLRAFEKEGSSLGGEKAYERNKSPFKASFFEEKASLTSYRRQGPQSSLMKDVKSSSKALEGVCQCGSKIQSKVDENTNDSSRTYHKSSLNARKYSQVLPPSKAKQGLFGEKPTYYPKKSYQKESYQASQSQLHEDPSRRHGSSISESVIQDHKKSLQNLKKLNQRMQFCLSTNLLSDHSKPGLSREDSLTFDELIKHV